MANDAKALRENDLVDGGQGVGEELPDDDPAWSSIGPEPYAPTDDLTGAAAAPAVWRG